MGYKGGGGGDTRVGPRDSAGTNTGLDNAGLGSLTNEAIRGGTDTPLGVLELAETFTEQLGLLPAEREMDAAVALFFATKMAEDAASPDDARRPKNLAPANPGGDVLSFAQRAQQAVGPGIPKPVAAPVSMPTVAPAKIAA